MLIRNLFYLTLIFTASACQTTQSPSSRTQSLEGLNPAELLVEAQRTNRFKDQLRLRLTAARVYLVDDDPNQALHALSPLDIRLASPEQGDEVTRLRAQALYRLGQYIDAETTLTSLQDWQAQDLWLLAQVCEQQGNFSCSADNYILAEEAYGFGSEQLPADVHERIWLALGRAQSAPKVFTHRYHHAWWLLQEQIRNAGSITGQIQAWHTWQRRYPSHPASIRPPQALLKLNNYQVPSIGFLLPLSGPYASAGRAVRDGMISAYLSEKGSDKPDITFFDSGVEPATALFERALSQGVDVVVGPLIKSKVGSFAAATQYSSVPRLVLNYLSTKDDTAPVQLSTDQPDNLFQFGIAIEDEAESLANHIYLEGLDKLLIVTSRDRWSQRALSAFQQSWPNTAAIATFDDIKALTGAVGDAMQVAASDSRRREVADILGKSLEFLPRARSDLDAVVALTNHIEAQALVPALNFHFANELPVYATSQATRGNRTADLRNFETTEMPMFTEPDAVQTQLIEGFELTNSPLADLYALGFDAYRIATWLPLLSETSQIALPAASGYLWLEPGGKFKRDLPVSRIAADGSRALNN